MSWNHDLFNFINQGMANPVLDVFFSALIVAGMIWVWLIFLPVLWLKKRRNEAVDMFFLILVVLAVTTLLKLIFAAPRPEDFRVVPIPVPGYFGYDVYSFPSNHASRAFACALFLSFYFRKWTVPLFVYAFLIGLAKIYVGAHYPLDIIGGAVFGGVLGWVFIQLGKYPPYAERREKLVKKVEEFGGRLFGRKGQEYRKRSELRKIFEALENLKYPRGPWGDDAVFDDDVSDFHTELAEYDGYVAGLISSLSHGPDPEKEKLLTPDPEIRRKLNDLTERYGEKANLVAYRQYLDSLDEFIKDATLAIEE